MNQNKPPGNGSVTPDRLVRGLLAKIGDVFDRVTGRSWRPGSSLATSELIERLKALLDLEAVTDEKKRVFVPHHIRLNMQWDKFSADSEESLKLLENELLVAAIDHINDRKYYTRGPLNIEVRPDYFTSGVVLRVGFDPIGTEEHESSLQINPRVTVDDAEMQGRQVFRLKARFLSGDKHIEKTFEPALGERISIGRGKSNQLQIDDESVSKVHSAIYIAPSGNLMLADTGSTNGTFLGSKRIAYGKAIDAGLNPDITFGGVTVHFEVDEIDSIESKTQNSDITDGNKDDNLSITFRVNTQPEEPPSEEKEK